MSRTLEPQVSASKAASARALEIAIGAGLEIVSLDSLDQLTGASQLFDDLWGTGPGESYLSPSLLRALEHAGNYGAGAYADGGLVGAVMGFLGQDGDGTYLHSHILGVSANHRGGNVGFALKQHQRAWAMELGLAKITWTFDPLVRRNAFFNLQKLGAAAASYLENFYGQMDDDINGTDESDRLLIDLRPGGAKVERAANGGVPELEVDVSDATVALSMSGDVNAEGWGGRVLCATPDDIVELRKQDPQGAVRWRRALRNTLGKALSDGYEVAGFTRSGWYVLDRA
jgi:predicted GNAT superfamily acetyltransferase